VYRSKASPNCRRIFASSNGICTQFAVANTSTGTANMGGDPTQNAIPSVEITSPRYIGFRVKRNGPATTSDLLVSDVGSISVPSFWNSQNAQAEMATPIATSATPSQTTRGSSSARHG